MQHQSYQAPIEHAAWLAILALLAALSALAGLLSHDDRPHAQMPAAIVRF